MRLVEWVYKPRLLFGNVFPNERLGWLVYEIQHLPIYIHLQTMACERGWLKTSLKHKPRGFLLGISFFYSSPSHRELPQLSKSIWALKSATALSRLHLLFFGRGTHKLLFHTIFAKSIQLTKDHWEQVISQKLADLQQILQFTYEPKVCAEMGPKIILLSLISIITSNYLAHWDSQCNEARRKGAK